MTPTELNQPINQENTEISNVEEDAVHANTEQAQYPIEL